MRGSDSQSSPAPTKRVFKKRSPAVTNQVKGCPHRWLLASPGGPMSQAVCTRCGATARFANYWPEASKDSALWKDGQYLARALRQE